MLLISKKKVRLPQLSFVFWQKLIFTSLHGKFYLKKSVRENILGANVVYCINFNIANVNHFCLVTRLCCSAGKRIQTTDRHSPCLKTPSLKWRKIITYVGYSLLFFLLRMRISNDSFHKEIVNVSWLIFTGLFRRHTLTWRNMTPAYTRMLTTSPWNRGRQC